MRQNSRYTPDKRVESTKHEFRTPDASGKSTAGSISIFLSGFFMPRPVYIVKVETESPIHILSAHGRIRNLTTFLNLEADELIHVEKEMSGKEYTRLFICTARVKNQYQG